MSAKIWLQVHLLEVQKFRFEKKYFSRSHENMTSFLLYDSRRPRARRFPPCVEPHFMELTYVQRDRTAAALHRVDSHARVQPGTKYQGPTSGIFQTTGNPRLRLIGFASLKILSSLVLGAWRNSFQKPRNRQNLFNFGHCKTCWYLFYQRVF